MNKSLIAILIVLLAAIGVGGAVVLNKNSDNKTTPSSSNTSTNDDASANTTPADTTTDQETQNSSTITYSDDGFSPVTLTVKSGTKITIVNDSSRILQFDSDPHPAHTDNPELNVGTISPGQSKTISVTKTGNHGYHNHLKDEDQGTLVVE